MSAEIGYQTNPDGPSWDEAEEEAEEAFATRVEDLFVQFAGDPARVEKADQWASEQLDAWTYEGMFAALADLHEKHPADLPGSDVLTRLYRLGRECHAKRTERLGAMAEDAANREREDA